MTTRMRSTSVLGLLVLALALVPGPRPASACPPPVSRSLAEPTIVRVIVVQTDDLDAYLKELQRGEALRKRIGAGGVLRVFQARFAGPETGAVVVTIEFPSLTAMAEADTKLSADAEFQTWLKGLDKLRKIVSDSLYEELSTS
jgi:hypothetical protein